MKEFAASNKTCGVDFCFQVLEKGPNNCQSAVLQILHCMVHYIDMNSSPVQAMNSDLLKVIAKYIEVRKYIHFNPSNAEAALVQSMRMQRFLKTIKILSCCQVFSFVKNY